jgi:hypothetical protein
VNEGWYVDGDPLETLGGTAIEGQQGWFDTPGMRGDSIVLAGQHGERWRPKKFQPGVIPMTVGIHGALSDWSVPAEGTARRSLFERNLEDFLRRVVKTHRRSLVQRVHATRSGNTPRRQALCQAANAITPQMTGYSYGAVSFEWQVPGAFWSDVDPRSQNLGYVVGGSAAQELELFTLQGQTGYCADSVITVKGPCSSVSVVDAETGEGWTYATSIGSGVSLVVDSGEFSAFRGVTDVLGSLQFSGSGPNLLEIVPAPSESRGPKLRVTAAGVGAGFAVTAVTRRKWTTP